MPVCQIRAQIVFWRVAVSTVDVSGISASMWNRWDARDVRLPAYTEPAACGYLLPLKTHPHTSDSWYFCLWSELRCHKLRARGERLLSKTLKETLGNFGTIRQLVCCTAVSSCGLPFDTSGTISLGNLTEGVETCSASAPLWYWTSSFWCGRSRLTSARRVISGLVQSKPRTAARVAGTWPGIRADAATSAPGWSGSPAADKTGRTATAPWVWPAPLLIKLDLRQSQRLECVKVSGSVSSVVDSNCVGFYLFFNYCYL